MFDMQVQLDIIHVKSEGQTLIMFMGRKMLLCGWYNVK